MIINSLLDNDLYKFTMQQVIFDKFTDAQVEYEFKWRNGNPELLVPFVDEIKREINHLGELKFTPAELQYLQTIRFFYPNYISFLKYFKLFPEDVVFIDVDNNNFTLHIQGSWLDTILLEVPILAIISEVMCKSFTTHDYETEGIKRLDEKIKLLSGHESNSSIKFSDFGTRRRYSKEWQRFVIGNLIKNVPHNFIGTSNVYFAKLFGIKAMGTMAHEYIMAGQGMPDKCSLRYSQQYMLKKWAEVYRGDLGIALSDTLGFTAFLADFDMFYAKLFDGCRHDSGDPFIWCARLIDHYNSLKINPKSKSAIFSDNLNFKLMIDLYRNFNPLINISFGIGTNLMNDVGITPLNIVIKMTHCNGHNVAKLSDSEGKQMCKSESYLRLLKETFNIK